MLLMTNYTLLKTNYTHYNYLYTGLFAARLLLMVQLMTWGGTGSCLWVLARGCQIVR